MNHSTGSQPSRVGIAPVHVIGRCTEAEPSYYTFEGLTPTRHFYSAPGDVSGYCSDTFALNCEMGSIEVGESVLEAPGVSWIFQSSSSQEASGSEPTREKLSTSVNGPSQQTDPDRRQRYSEGEIKRLIVRKCRPSSKPVAGNNRYGRKGKPRCEQCRAWKVKVLPA